MSVTERPLRDALRGRGPALDLRGIPICNPQQNAQVPDCVCVRPEPSGTCHAHSATPAEATRYLGGVARR